LIKNLILIRAMFGVETSTYILSCPTLRGGAKSLISREIRVRGYSHPFLLRHSHKMILNHFVRQSFSRGRKNYLPLAPMWEREILLNERQ